MSRKEILPGIFLNHVQSDKFKLASLSFTVLTQLKRETASMNALLPSVLCRGSRNYDTLDKLSCRFEELYGSSISCMVKKYGEIQAVGIALSYPEAAFLPGNKSIAKDVISLGCEVLLNPATRGGLLLPAYVDSEKEKLAELIRSRINDKTGYAISRCIEEMCCFEDYSVSRFGTEEDCERINYKKLTKHYRSLLQTSPIEIFYIGRDTLRTVEAFLKDALCTMARGEIDCEIGTDIRMNAVEEQARFFEEEMTISQSRIVLGFRLGEQMEEPDRAVLSVFNTLYGGGITSKLFSTVREKMHLCYSISSSINIYKGILLAVAGIDASCFEGVRDEMLHQLEEIKNGNISDEELTAAKAAVISDLRSVEDSQSSIEGYFLSQTITGESMDIGEYIDLIGEVTKEDLMEAAKCTECDMIYFLKGTEPDEETEEDRNGDAE
jgi:predicted Zn-dependent peptidase